MKKRILLVEDDLTTVDVVQLGLEALGYEIMVGTNGEEGVQIAESQLPDLIVMDIRMPRMSGFEATSQIRKNPKTRDIPILAATAKAFSEDREECLAIGCDGYIVKPFTYDQLDAAIKEVLIRRSASTR